MKLIERITAVEVELDAIQTSPEYLAFSQSVDAMFDLASAYVVDSSHAAESAAGELTNLKGLQKRVADAAEDISKKCHGLHKKSLTVYRPLTAKLGEGETVLKKAIGTWQEAERQRLAEEARKERERIAEEQRRLREESEARQAEAAEAERLRRMAEDTGDADLADQLAEQVAQLEESAQEAAIEAETIPAPIIQAPPKLAGVSTRENWSAEVTDLMALVRAVAAGTVPIRAIQANGTFLNQQARSLKADLNYPGVRAVCEKSIAAGAS